MHQVPGTSAARAVSSQQEVPPRQEIVYTAPADSGDIVLGRTLVSLLDEACERHDHPQAFNQRAGEGWTALSSRDFRAQAEALALGLGALGLARGERVALYMHSDVSFCVGDMACLLAGLVDVPIYLTHPPDAVKHILNETESRVLLCSDAGLLKDIAELLPETQVETVVVWATPPGEVALPTGLELLTFDEVAAKGREVEDAAGVLELLRAQVRADDVATLIYTSGTTGLPKGVILTHENISSNAVAAITGLKTFRRGPGGEVALSFLPLTHIFARTLHYCLMWVGASVYFSTPDDLRDDLKTVKPTFFASVPRVLEKAFERILATGQSLTGVKKRLFDWSLELAGRYDVELEPSGLYALQLGVADRLVFSKWREALGGDIRQIIVGGAALRADLVNTFAAAGITVLQGYGLTETSPVIAYNRPDHNKAGTVGPALAGVEIKLGEDKEILARGPNIMKGYYKKPDKTAEVLDADGWFHTGDQGEMTEDGYLRITGRLKNLFKLSTGKYVMPQPLEEKLEADGLIDTALVVGEGEKYCGALLFVNKEALVSLAGRGDEGALEQDQVQTRLKTLMTEANASLPHWSNVKKIALVLGEVSLENGLLTPKMSVKRNKVLEKYGDYLEALYGRGEQKLEAGVVVDLGLEQHSQR